MTEPDTVTEPVNEDDELCTDCGVRLGDHCGEPQCEGWCDDCDEYACDGCTCNEWEN